MIKITFTKGIQTYMLMNIDLKFNQTNAYV